jgi:hypothetical protein
MTHQMTRRARVHAMRQTSTALRRREFRKYPEGEKRRVTGFKELRRSHYGPL